MQITAELIYLFLAASGSIGGLWWRIESKIESVRKNAEAAAKDLSLYKEHVSETYLTREGLKEATGPILAAINALILRVEHLNDRIDRVIERQAEITSIRKPAA